eukprot:TRINITY_DN28788_c0_g1_i1.p2 TRINITY_DN28788_c0_g1~~TRINITY_DN28788_c0_g1_i1.p2  ORF type:complete len:519 (+),score=246.93 TRINITY_DN28788_c0_g1_i1:52-1608(+)
MMRQMVIRNGSRTMVLRTSARWASEKIQAPPMVYISGEEMTRYAMQLVLDEWIQPHIDTTQWEFYDLSCKSRDDTEDRVLTEAVDAGKRLRAIFKEPTITPTSEQVKELGLRKAWGSPNGAMRRGWNGITISRDTIHIDGVELGYKRPVLFERHAVGGEYGAGWKAVGSGKLVTTFYPIEGGEAATCTRTDFTIVDQRDLRDSENVAVVYHNPLDNVDDLAHHFFKRCLEERVVPYVVTKKTVFKWQESFWSIMKRVFDESYKADYLEAGLLEKCGGELQHLISDAATMQIIRWTDGGFGMAAHNYDGDMLTDEVAQVHRSPGFITSNLIGKADDGTLIKEFEASHGTVADLWHMHLAGKETSFNPLGMVEAIIGAMDHAAALSEGPESEKVLHFTQSLKRAVHTSFRLGEGTRDMVGPSGLTTEQFVATVKARLQRYMDGDVAELKETEKCAINKETPRDPSLVVDREAILSMFSQYDLDGNGTIDVDEFESMLVKLGVAPLIQAPNTHPELEAGQV